MNEEKRATNRLIQAIRDIVDLPDEQELSMDRISKPVFLNKGDHFIRAGEVPRKLGFVNQGLFRYYYTDEKGKEFTKGFFPENTFLSSYSAMIQERASYFGIEALEDSTIVTFDIQSWNELLNQHLCWNKLLIAILEKGFVKKENREREFLLFDAEKRYALFLDQYPGLEKRIKQHMIASYLGITDVALSRIRKKIGLVNIG